MSEGADVAVITHGLRERGWCHCADFLSALELAALRSDLLEHGAQLAPAAIGRADRQIVPGIRSDETLWLTGASAAQNDFLARMETLRAALNRELFLGLFDYEAHYARYAPGAFYRRHLDSFRDSGTRRLLSTVVYLNPRWRVADGGELVLWDAQECELARIAPQGGSAVFFLSEQFPHEVLPASVERYNIAGWFRQRGAA